MNIHSQDQYGKNDKRHIWVETSRDTIYKNILEHDCCPTSLMNYILNSSQISCGGSTSKCILDISTSLIFTLIK